ncbi:LOG family protein [Patescibacteria group bacterium]|nr:LOG family protein [Patescibacteria group bacterium]MBU1015862.1 LOG family protein [Patescibacteria group bacterium]MBU1685389.1 LOG family protein [Patescibacteria group bacterium]MBU1938452.1 LOG family protein [Patescibacteria group bacterium]
MKYRIGVMGSAQGPTIKVQENIKKAIEIGQEIAKADCILVNGACPGLPDEAAYGAKNVGGMTMGISPAFSEEEHTKTYKSPKENYDIIIYTGMGLMERDLINIRSVDAIIVMGGGVGTLNEFAVAFDDMKIVGVLTGTGGVSDHIDKILEICGRKVEDYVIFDSEPKRLVAKVLERLTKYPRPVTEDERIFKSGKGE